MKFKLIQTFVEGRKGEILDAALSVFMKKGYEGGSMRDIAGLTGVSEPAIYRHYAGKEDLFINLIKMAGEKIASETCELLDNIDPANIKQSLKKIQNNRQQAFKSYFPVIQTIILGCFHNPIFMDTFREYLAGPIIKKLFQVIPKIDSYYGNSFTIEEKAKRVRIYISTIVGYFITSTFFEKQDGSILIETLIKTMNWQDRNPICKEDQFIEELPKDFNIIKAEELKKKMTDPDFQKSNVIIDLRGPEAFAKEHIPGSLQISIKDLPDKYKSILPDQNQEIITVCSGGIQSVYAAMYLKMKNYQKVKSLGGGFSKWNKE